MSSGAFDLLDRPLVYVPVKWKGIGQDENENAIVIDHLVEVQVELLDRDEFAEWIIDANKDFTDKAERATHELATIKRVAKGWRKIKSGGRAVEFNDDNLGKLIRWPGFVTAFGETYMETWRAELVIREGNSDGSPANGPAGEPTDATRPDTTSAS